MIKIETYQKEEKVRKQLLQVLARVDHDFVPPLSQRKSLEFWMTLFEKGVLLYASLPEEVISLGFLVYYPSLNGKTLKELRPYVNVGPVVSPPNSNEIFRDAYLHFIAVSPGHRGKNIASSLLAALLDEVQKRGIPRLRVVTWSTNTESLKLYKKYNFRVFYRLPDDRGKGIDSVYLEVKLPLQLQQTPMRYSSGNPNQELEKQLETLLRHVTATTPFYREKYRGISLHPFSMEVFENLPYFTRDEYRQREHLDDLYCPQQESHYVFISGGSTGIAKASFWNVGYIDNQITTLAGTFRQLGISSHDRAMNLFTPGMSGTHYGFNLALEKLGTTIVPLGGDAELPVTARFAKDLGVNVLIGNPAALILLLEYLVSENPGFTVKTIIYAGENLSRVQYNFMKKHARNIYSPIYSSTETGIVGTQCPRIPVGTFHLADTVYVELIDPENEKLTGENQGEIVVTSLLNRASPCIRYRLGDLVTFPDEACSCGNPAPLVKLAGRVDDAITLGSTNWSYDEIVTPLLDHLDYPSYISSNLCLHLVEKERKVQLIIQYQARSDRTDEEFRQLENTIQTFMNHQHAVVGPLVRKKTIPPVAVERVSSFESLRNPQTGKIRFVIDHRKKSMENRS